MKDFYRSQVHDEKTAGIAKIEFLDCKTRGKPDVQLYNFSAIGTYEEFLKWVSMEFGYLRHKVTITITITSENK